MTDSVTFAWLADVVVDPLHRGRGFGTCLVQGILSDLEPLGLRRVLLHAAPGAGALYERLGWEPLDEPDTWMERRPGPAGL